jgi:DNA-binding transcriptional MerR regulator
MIAPGEKVTDEKPKRGYLRSAELARLAGVSTDTLRHYERKGLLARTRRSANGYREYPASDLDRVRLVRGALAIGFTLDELARILNVRDRGGAPCHQVRALAGTKLTEVETQLRELTSLRDELRRLLRNWDALLAKNSPERASPESLRCNSSRRAQNHRLTKTPIHRKKQSKETHGRLKLLWALLVLMLLGYCGQNAAGIGSTSQSSANKWWMA